MVRAVSLSGNPYMTAKRLSSDAAIVLRNAGYSAIHADYNRGKPMSLVVKHPRGGQVASLRIESGTVDNEQVEALLKAMK